jgi:hypothetical protein
MNTLDITKGDFTQILQDYYVLKTLKSEEIANNWLDTVLRSEAGIAATKELVMAAITQANEMISNDTTLEDYEVAMDERKEKKNEELN